jgi:hypothetical protein
VNMLVKLDELKVSHSSVKAFMEDIIWTLRHYKNRPFGNCGSFQCIK